MFPSVVQDRHLELENSGELGRGKKFTKPVGGRKKNWGRGRGRGKGFIFPSPHPTPTEILAPIFSQSPANPKWRLNTRKMKTTKTVCTAGYGLVASLLGQWRYLWWPFSLFFTSGRLNRFHHVGGPWNSACQSRLLRHLSFVSRTIPQSPPRPPRPWGNKAYVDLALP